MAKTLTISAGIVIVILCIILSIAHSGKPHNDHSFDLSSQRKLVEDVSQFETAKNKLKKLLSLIYNRYEFGGPYGNKFFMTTNNISPETWDILKMKLATKMLTPNATFLMIFSGSSVTAGHDNYYNQSYPAIFDKRMSDIFSSVGIDLQVHDIALGANNCSPYVLCYESMGGFDPDFLNWEQSYNCGHDDAVFEATARIAGMSANKGIVYYSASGAWSPSQCPPSTDAIPYCAEEWEPATAGLSEWNADEEAVQDMKHQLFLFNQDKPSYARFTGPFRNDYKGVGMMGFNVWEQNQHCRFKNPKSGKEEACNGIDSVEGCAMKFMTKEASLYGSDNGQGANWHPTRAFHMLRGEAIAWIFGLVMLETINEVTIELKSKSRESLRDEYASFLKDLTSDVPADPKKCKFPYHCESRPQCFTDYKPHYAKNMTLSEIVVGQTKWTYDDAALGEWSLHYGYLDAKPDYHTTDDSSGEIYLKIKIDSARHFWLCGLTKEALEHVVVKLDENVADTDTLKDTYTPKENRMELSKFNNIGNECKQFDDVPQGTHVIGVSTDPTQPGHKSSITHLITWP